MEIPSKISNCSSNLERRTAIDGIFCTLRILSRFEECHFVNSRNPTPVKSLSAAKMELLGLKLFSLFASESLSMENNFATVDE